MRNIINDVVEEIKINPNRFKFIIKWVVSVSVSLVGVAFVLGQFKSSFFNKIDKFEESLNKNTATIEQLKVDVNKGFTDVNARVDKVYDDATNAFNEYQEFNKKQLILVLDYGHSNKNMLKEILELNIAEKSRSIENQLSQAKNEQIDKSHTIVVEPVSDKDYYSSLGVVAENGIDTIIFINGAKKSYYEKIVEKKFNVSRPVKSKNYPERYDFNYTKN